MQSTVTYCPEDNKLRLYVGRVPRDEYEALRKAGYTSTPKQDCDFVATWTPAREDLAREYLDDDEDIGDEDYSPEERADDRADRFEGYRDKRRSEATEFADRFDDGPQVFGHQNHARAERQARRHDRLRGRAVSQWSKAEYWQQRTEGVIRHALYKSSAKVRRGRLLRLEAEQRKHEAGRQAYAKRYATWERIATMDGADELLPLNDGGYADPSAMNAAQRLAYGVSSDGRSWWSVYHPTSEQANEKAREIWKHGFDADDLLTKTQFVGAPFERLTPRQVAQLYLSNNPHPDTPGTYDARWSDHYNLRIGYEKAMLENEGGMAADQDIEPGGWIRSNGRARGCLNDTDAGWVQVQKVNKSPATGRVTSVKVWGTSSGYTAESNYREYATRPALVTIEVERLAENAYRAPTDEERADFKRQQAAERAERKRTAPKKPALVNPTDDDAGRLQALWNAKAAKSHAESNRFGTFVPAEVCRMTQSEYSARSKGSYSSFETVQVCEHGEQPRRWDGNKRAENPPVAFKVRTRYASGTCFYTPKRIVILTDKPQKPLPLNWETLADTAAAENAASGPPIRVEGDSRIIDGIATAAAGVDS